ncbi:lipopolysaccharide biosynthesis protein [Nitrobacter sp. TKz-YC02]|uniref:lipopolysaccharide biosynthesis protein n=1 Tax=Nitrobacter sp. TKz-YC02 TaxID=3398704 RepID=UPI003CE88A60
MKDLKQRTIRSGLAKLCSQTADFVLRIASLVIMARLLEPKDFGLIAMVTAVTGFYGLFTSAGLSAATIQAPTVSNEQLSTLFWINIAVGTVLAFLCVLTAPLIVRFYHEPRLFWVTVAVAIGFIINAATVQHSALLQRQLRYVTLAVIETLSQLVSFTVGTVMALKGFGYWTLVGSAIATPACFIICLWTVTQWTPDLPRRNVRIGAMLRFGGTLTLNSVVVYIAYNLEKVLLGRFWGANVLGIYGRAYQLINVPTDNLNSAVGGVTFSALSRLQNDPARFKSYFLKAYALVNSLTLPITLFSTLFGDLVISVCLGPKWMEAVPIFRLLAPTVMVFGIINPLGWLLLALGLYGRSFQIALVIAPLVITAYLIGLPYGPTGVALAYSSALVLWLVPHILWCTYRTVIFPRDLLWTLSKPLVSALVAAAFAFLIQRYIGESLSPLPRLLLAAVTMGITYILMLLFVMGQNALYLDILNGIRSSSRLEVTDAEGRSV